MTEFYHIDLEDLVKPRDGFVAVVDHYWWESDDGILDARVGRNRKMQANRDLKVMEYVKDRGVKPYADHVPLLIPVAYYPRD